MPFGPATPGTPTQPASWYGTLAASRPGNCADLQSLAASGLTPADPQRTDVYVGVADACLALASDSADDWAAARTALTAARGATTLDCLDREAYRLATQLLAAHDADPATSVRTGPPTSTTACPYEVTGLTPTSGDAGDTVVIHGRYLWAAEAVYFGSAKATILDAGRDGLQVEVPAVAQSGSVRVRVVSSYNGDGPDIPPLTATSPQDFTYTTTPITTASTSASASASAGASASPTDSSTPAASGSASGAADDAGRRDASRRPRE